MQDKHFVILHGKENRDILINKLNHSKTVYHIEGIGGEAEPEDIIVGNHQVTDWIMAKYIVDNYDDLHEYTIFTQADPTDHVHEPLLAFESTLTAQYGSFCFARSIYEQYTLTWDRLHSVYLSSKRLGIDFYNANNSRKFIYMCYPGVIFYVHRDRIREQPKSFYENLIKCDNDVDFFKYVEEYNHPAWLWQEIDKKYPEFKKLSKEEKIKKITSDVPKAMTLNSSKPKDDYFGVSTEPLWSSIFFAGKELFDLMDTAQATIGNKLYFDVRKNNYDINFKFSRFPYSSNMSETILNFKRLENNWFDLDCPNYLKWRKTLVEKTIWEGEQRGFDGLGYVKYLEQSGCKHISF
jgi:hypothetical protein